MTKMMLIFIISVFSILTLNISAEPYKMHTEFSSKNPLVIFNFDKCRKKSNLIGGSYGQFDVNPDDENAFIKLQFKKDRDIHKKGYHLKVTYDVESDRPTFNGIWTKLKTLDLSRFEAVSLKIKGDKKRGFSSKLRIEIKDNQPKKIVTTLDYISDKWKNYIILFDNFDGDPDDLDYKNIKEFIIIFEDWLVTKKTGRYYFDDICFIPKKGVVVKYSDIIKFDE